MDIKKEFYIVKKFILDRHPLVDSMYKTVVFKDPHGLGEPSNIMSWECTIKDIFDSYHCCWFLDDTTVVHINPNIMLSGKQEIMNNRELLPNNLRLCKKKFNNKSTLLLHAVSADFCCHDVYKAVCFK